MDHLPVPADATLPRPRVPLVCEGYDGGKYLEYPNRTSWTHAASGQRTPFWYRESLNPSNTGALEAFLQAWIFFGLLHHVLGPEHLFVHSEFIEAAEDGSKFVHTRNLSKRLQEWASQLKQRHEKESRQAVCSELASCLYSTRLIMLVFTQECHRDFHPAIRMSLEAIIESIWEVA